MPAPVSLYPAAATSVPFANTPIVAIFGPVLGGVITNPGAAADQGLDTAEVLWVDIVQDAAPGVSPTTFALQPGDSFALPANLAGNVSVTAASAGHRFSGVLWQPQTQFPPTPQPGPWPPAGPTGLTKAIPAYLYEQYADDEDLQAFVRAYNGQAQGYVDWFNAIALPVYTGPLITGALLDWVAAGLYGLSRPALSSGRNRNLGPLNTYALNTLALNARHSVGPSDVAVTSDDVFKRILTWLLFKGDGKVFDVRWLKRRIMRFLLGANGANPNIDATYQVSVTFGVGNQVNITLVTGARTITGGAILNRFALNGAAFNALASTFVGTAPLPNAAILKEAIDSGVLELPFQHDWVVTI